jgi:hypothetical protein
MLIPFPFSPFALVYTHPMHRLVNLLMREPLARLQILLLERRIQHTQPPYLARTRRVVALYVCFGFAVGGLEGEGTCGLVITRKQR